jgi:hypothetical protein
MFVLTVSGLAALATGYLLAPFAARWRQLLREARPCSQPDPLPTRARREASDLDASRADPSSGREYVALPKPAVRRALQRSGVYVVYRCPHWSRAAVLSAAARGLRGHAGQRALPPRLTVSRYRPTRRFRFCVQSSKRAYPN